MRLLHACFVIAAAFLTLSEAAEVTSPITVPLHFTETGAGTYKLGIYAGIGDGGKPALFEFDTGGAGLYAAYASANVSRSDWWGSGVVSQNQTIHIVYDSGNTYNGTLVSAPVSLYSAHHSTTPLVTIPPALLGQMNQISKTNQNNGNVTPLWGPDGELNGEPPVNGVFYGDFGMAPKYAPNGISNLIAQMTYSSNVTAGFRVHADRANQTAWGASTCIAVSHPTYNCSQPWMTAGPPLRGVIHDALPGPRCSTPLGFQPPASKHSREPSGRWCKGKVRPARSWWARRCSGGWS